MKKRLLILTILPALLLAACNKSSSKSSSASSSINDDTDIATYAKEISIYDLDNIKEEGQIDEGYNGKVSARFVEGEDYIPYVSLKQYAEFYKSHFDKGISSEFEQYKTTITWSVSTEQYTVFITRIDVSTSEILVAGSLDSYYKDNDNPVDTTALSAHMMSKYESVSGGSGYATYSYANTGIKTFKLSGEYYFPLSLLDLSYSYDSGMYFYYNYANIYSTKDADHFSDKHFYVNGTLYNVDSQMAVSKSQENIPQYLIDFNVGTFLFLMDNMYGLKEIRGIKSMKSYYESAGIYDKLFSTNNRERAQAYADALDVFDDNHTALVSTNGTWGEDFFTRRRLSQGIASRNALRNRLENYRQAAYEAYFPGQDVKAGDDIVYSADGKTAMYMFDSFSFAPKEIYEGDDMEAIYEKDTFLNLAHIFATIKEKGGVENIVLDISTNGGGTVGVMMKLLSLISKSNGSYVYYHQATSGQVISAYCRVDSNNDDNYDLSDCFGNDFNFYILTSDCSFSCANAFPCTAQVQGIAKIIGQKSGGGECAVAIHYLPNSQYVYHSSHLHLGDYDKKSKKFNGFEGGAKPDIEIANEEDFFDIEKLNSYIANAQ